jgi:hypothetical protein
MNYLMRIAKESFTQLVCGALFMAASICHKVKVPFFPVYGVRWTAAAR